MSDVEQHDEELEEKINEEFNEDELALANERSEELNAVETEVIENLDFEEVEAAFVDGTELEDFESAEVEDLEFVEQERVVSIVESLLFSTDRPQSLALIRQAFKGTSVKSKDLKNALEDLMVEYAGGKRGVTLEEVSGGYQLRTKVDNIDFLKRMVKGRSFKLSGPALEVLAITAYKQPCVKSQIDEIRGVESGHLLRGLMERGLVRFAGKSELPGKPMYYETTKKFLEIFGLRNIKELPSLSEIDDLIPDGIGEIEEEKATLDQITGEMAKEAGTTYSEGEEELAKISDQLEGISTSSDFFEEEKRREKEKKEADKAQMIQEAMIMGDDVSQRDKNWLERYEAQKLAEAQAETEVTAAPQAENVDQEIPDLQLVDASENENENTTATGDKLMKATASKDVDVTDETDGTEETEADLPDTLVSAFAEEGEVLEVALEASDSSLAEINFEKMKQDIEIFSEDSTAKSDEEK